MQLRAFFPQSAWVMATPIRNYAVFFVADTFVNTHLYLLLSITLVFYFKFKWNLLFNQISPKQHITRVIYKN